MQIKSSNGDEIIYKNFRDDQRKKFTTWQIVNLEMKKHIKTVSYSIYAGNCNVVTMMQYVHYLAMHATELARFIKK